MRLLTTISLAMSRLMAVCLFAISVFAIACSSTSSEPTEQGLIQRSEMANNAVNAQNWAGIYQFYPPEVHDICSLAEFENEWGANYEREFGALKEALGAGMDLTIVVETNGVAIAGTDGYVTLELNAFASDGQGVIENLLTDNAQLWRFIDGEWFIGEDVPDWFCRGPLKSVPQSVRTSDQLLRL